MNALAGAGPMAKDRAGGISEKNGNDLDRGLRQARLYAYMVDGLKKVQALMQHLDGGDPNLAAAAERACKDAIDDAIDELETEVEKRRKRRG